MPSAPISTLDSNSACWSFPGNLGGLEDLAVDDEGFDTRGGLHGAEFHLLSSVPSLGSDIGQATISIATRDTK